MQSTINYSNEKLGYKENLTYKQVENLIKEISLGSVLQVLSTIT